MNNDSQIINYNQKISNISNSIIKKKNMDIIKLINENIIVLQGKVKSILEESKVGFDLNYAICNFEKRINVPYHFYTKKEKFSNRLYISLIPPDEWKNRDNYFGCYKLNDDYTWSKV